MLAGADAEAPRIEVARRLLQRADETADPGRCKSQPRPAPRRALCGIRAARRRLAVYLAFGAPGLPGRPYAARLDTPLEHATAGDLVARVEAHLRDHPDDGRGWDVLAPVYLRMGDYTQAADAFQEGGAAAGSIGQAPGRLRARAHHAAERHRQ